MPARAPLITKAAEKELRDLGQRLRDRRKELGVSAVATAEAAGLSRVTLYRIEKGEGSVAVAAYLSVVRALGYALDLVDPHDRLQRKVRLVEALPKKIRLAHYPQLKRLAWQLKKTQTVTPQEALELYERNWRHVDEKAMGAREKKLLTSLLAAFGRERLIV